MVVDAAEHVPDELVSRPDKRIRNYLAFPSFHRDSVRKQLEKEIGKPPEHQYVEFLKLDTLLNSELEALGVPQKRWFRARDEKNPSKYNPNHHLAWAISLFRMRARLVQDIDALIVLGGKDDGKSWGRFSGIAEEVMLALALGKPTYVLGGRGGGAYAVGKLLGLDYTIANPDTCLVEGDIGSPLSSETYANYFALPGHPGLPRTTSKIRTFLFERAVTTSGWPRNGLRLEENRELFCIHLSMPQRTAICQEKMRGSDHCGPFKTGLEPSRKTTPRLRPPFYVESMRIQETCLPGTTSRGLSRGDGHDASSHVVKVALIS